MTERTVSTDLFDLHLVSSHSLKFEMFTPKTEFLASLETKMTIETSRYC